MIKIDPGLSHLYEHLLLELVVTLDMFNSSREIVLVAGVKIATGTFTRLVIILYNSLPNFLY